MKNTILKTLLIGACLFQGLYTSAIAAPAGAGGKPFPRRADLVMDADRSSGADVKADDSESGS